MERNQFWLFLGLAVAFGLCMEVIKNTDLTSAHSNAMAGHELAADDLNDVGYSTVHKRIKSSFPKRRDLQQSGLNARVAGLAPDWGAQAEATGEAVKPADGAKAKTEEQKKKEKADAEKKKKEEAKKKKKKKKKKTVEGQKDAKDPNTTEADDSDDKKADSGDSNGAAGAMANSGPGGYLGSAPFAEPTGIPQTAEEWEAILLVEPDFRKTSMFIKYEQTSLVKQDVYYTVVGKMLEDTRTEMRELGVMALGSVTSPRSFAMLTTLLYEEKGTTALKTQIKTYMRLYTQLQNLKFLASAMTLENDPNANYEALRLFRIAADYHLKRSATQTPHQQDNGTPRQPAASSVSRYFESFVGLLTNLSQSSHDSGFRLEAGQALDNLQSLLAQQPV